MILQLKLSILMQLKQQKKLSGLEILFMSLVWFLMILVQLSYTVIMMGPLYKQKNLNHTKSPKTSSESFIFARNHRQERRLELSKVQL